MSIHTIISGSAFTALLKFVHLLETVSDPLKKKFFLMSGLKCWRVNEAKEVMHNNTCTYLPIKS